MICSFKGPAVASQTVFRSLTAMMNLAVSLAVFTTIGAAIMGIGSTILPRGLLSRKFAAGAIGLFVVLSIAGWLGLFRNYVLWGILACGILAFMYHLKSLKLPSGIWWLAGGLLVLLPLAILPPFSRDAMNHHLYLPGLWLSSGGIVRPDWGAFLSYPYMVETFYTLAGGTFGFSGARMISLLGLAATGIALLELHGKNRVLAVLSVIVLLSMPELLRNATWAYSDTFLVFFSVMAFLELIRDDGDALAAVVWAGAAALCKYNGVLVLAGTLLILPVRFRGSWKRAPLFLGVALLMCGWWALPNLIQWGNPAYPLMRGIFGPVDQLSERGVALVSAARAYTSPPGGILDFLLLPIRLSITGQWDNPRLFDGSSGPLLLAGLILFLVVRRGRTRYLLLPLLFLSSALLFRGSAIRIRYFLPGLAMLSVPAALGIFTVFRRMKPYLAVILTGVCVLWTGSRIAELYSDLKPWLLFGEGNYLANRLEYLSFYEEAETVLDMEHLTLFVNMGNRAFYFPSEVVYDEHRFPIILLEKLWAGMNAGEIADELRSDGVSHLAVHMGYTSINIPFELSSDEMMEWREFVAMHMKPVITRNPYVLFELN